MWAERLQSSGVSKEVDLDIPELAEWAYMSKSLPNKLRGEEWRTSSLISVSHAWLLERGGDWGCCQTRRYWFSTCRGRIRKVSWLFSAKSELLSMWPVVDLWLLTFLVAVTPSQPWNSHRTVRSREALCEWSSFTPTKPNPAVVDLAILVLSAP